LSFDEVHQLTAAKLLSDNDFLGRVDAVDLKHVGSLMWFVATITLRRFVAGSGRRPPHQTLTSQSLTQSLLVTCRRFAPWHSPHVRAGEDQSAGRPQRVRMLQGDGGPGKVLDQGALDGAQMFVPLRAGYDIANQGVKSYQAAEAADLPPTGLSG
jgi:hypothetical protein